MRIEWREASACRRGLVSRDRSGRRAGAERHPRSDSNGLTAGQFEPAVFALTHSFTTPVVQRSAARDKSASLRIEAGPRLLELVNFSCFEQRFEHPRQMRSHCFASRVGIARAQRFHELPKFVGAWPEARILRLAGQQSI